MKPHFSTIKANFYPSQHVNQAKLFEEIGWGDLAGKSAYTNTCAIRMSLALIKSGMTIPGRLRINSGRHKGALIEPGQAKLSSILTRSVYFGEPEKFTRMDAQDGIGVRSGIVSFFDIHPQVETAQGHIDLVSQSAGRSLCGTSCFWLAKEVWFWPLK